MIECYELLSEVIEGQSEHTTRYDTSTAYLKANCASAVYAEPAQVVRLTGEFQAVVEGVS